MAAMDESGPSSPMLPSSHRPSPRTGAAAAPVVLPGHGPSSSPRASSRAAGSNLLLLSANPPLQHRGSILKSTLSRPRSHSGESASQASDTSEGRSTRKIISDASIAVAKAKSRSARKLNDSLVYLDGPQVYACAECRTHLTSHDEIISKSFHGRHGRAYLFDNCVNVRIGPAEDRRLMTGLHSVCDIFCIRCETMVGWTYTRAYEQSQKYKEGKFVIEKINLHLEESDYFDVAPPAGERKDRFRARSISWGNEESCALHRQDMVYEYHPHDFIRSSDNQLVEHTQF